MTSQTGKRIITMHILFNNSRSKDNQTMKFCQLIEYNIRGIFLEKSYTECGGGTSPRPYLSAYISLSYISLDQQPENLFRLFLLYVQADCYRNILSLRCRSFDFKAF